MRPAQGRMFVGLRNPGCDRRLISEIEIGQSRRFPEGAGGGKNFVVFQGMVESLTHLPLKSPGRKDTPGDSRHPGVGESFL